MKLAVTGATGQLGQLVIKSLLNKGVNASDIISVVRNPEKAAAMAAQGIEVRQADYNDSEALNKALQGIDRLLLISGNDLEQRAEQHQKVIEAAKHNNVGFIAYTSLLKADTSSLLLAVDHKATEIVMKDSGIPYTFLRNSWYLENYTSNLGQFLSMGAIMGSAGEGKVSAASRQDYATAAAEVLSGEGHENKIYELGGESFSMTELAQTLSNASGKSIVYNDMPTEAYKEVLLSTGMPEGFASILANADAGLAKGDLFTDSGDLESLLDYPTTSLADALSASLKELQPA